MKSEKILLDLINKGSFDQQVVYRLIREILGISAEEMKKKINVLRQKFIDEWKEKWLT